MDGSRSPGAALTDPGAAWKPVSVQAGDGRGPGCPRARARGGSSSLLRSASSTVGFRSGVPAKRRLTCFLGRGLGTSRLPPLAGERKLRFVERLPSHGPGTRPWAAVRALRAPAGSARQRAAEPRRSPKVPGRHEDRHGGTSAVRVGSGHNGVCRGPVQPPALAFKPCSDT